MGESAHLQEGKIAQIDRHIRLFLGPDGARYMVPSQSEQYRRQGYAYYDEKFDELVYSIAVRPNVKGGLELSGKPYWVATFGSVVSPPS